MTSEGGQRNRLSKSQSYKLTRWLEERLKSFSENETTSSQAAAQAQGELGFEVTQRNVLSIAGSAQEAILPHRWPSSGAGEVPDGGHVNRRLAVVVGVLEEVREKLDVQLSDTLKVLWNELQSQVAAVLPSDTSDDSDENSPDVSDDAPTEGG